MIISKAVYGMKGIQNSIFFFKQLWLSVNKTTDTKIIPPDYFFFFNSCDVTLLPLFFAK